MTTLALVHPTDLLALELRETLERRPDAWRELRLLSNRDDEIGTLADVAGAATMVAAIEPGSFDDVDVAFFAGPTEAHRDVLASLPATTTAIVLVADGEEHAGAPWVADVNLARLSPGAVDAPLLSPHPVIVGLAHLLAPLRGFGLHDVAATAMLPVSVFGRRGLDELFEQTRDILSFQTNVQHEVLPTRLAFNVLRSGDPPAQVAEHLEAIFEERVPLSLQVLQAGIFHGVSFGLHVELADDPGLDAVREALAAHPPNDVAEGDADLLGPVDAASRDEMLIASVDATREGTYAIWAVVDNLTRAGALNAVALLERVVGHRAT
ncbi:MAG: Asd/ArgC dimerization domain-containing protein [Acidobacteriota bacterium]